MANTPARSVRVPDEIWQAAQAKAASKNRPLSDVIVILLSRWTGVPDPRVKPAAVRNLTYQQAREELAAGTQAVRDAQRGEQEIAAELGLGTPTAGSPGLNMTWRRGIVSETGE